MPEKAKHPVRTTKKSLRLIETLKETGSARVTELAERLDIGSSAVHNHLNTLKEHGYVVQDGKEYRLGLKFLDLGGYVRNKMMLYQKAEPEINDLAMESGELVNLMTEEMGKGVYLYRAKGSRALDFDTYAGRRKHLHSTALGKAMLAELPEERVEEIIDVHGLPPETENTITDRETLYDELQSVRDKGIAIDDEETSKGVRCIAEAIQPESRGVMGALSITAPINQMTGERFEEELPDMIRSTVNVIELQIKYNE